MDNKETDNSYNKQDKMIRLSIILPVYNQQKCIEYCIKSLLNQGVNDVAEAIFVDDGSTDETLSILRRYEELHPTFIKVISKRNGGVSSARNVGIESAKGEWLLFVDPDDFLAPNTLSFILDKYDREDIDVIRFGVNLTEGYDLWDVPIALNDEIQFCGSTKDYVKIYEITTSFPYLIKKHVLSNIRYDEDLAIFEDLFFVYRFLLQDNMKILRISLRGYYYVQIPTSVTNLKTSTAYRKRTNAALTYMEKMIDFRQVYVKDAGIRQKIDGKNECILWGILANLRRIDNPSIREIGEFRSRYNNLRRKTSYIKSLKTTLLSSLMLLPPPNSLYINCL